MPEIAKFSGVESVNFGEVSGVSKGSIADINGFTLPSAASLLLDLYPGAVAAYSVRLLNTNYTGACMRVRRSSDSLETDIGFDSSGYIDEAAVATHCGSSIGYISRWYGQDASGGTGSGTDAVQTASTQQPRIYSGSSMYRDVGGKACVYNQNVQNGNVGFDISSDLRTTAGASSVFTVFHLDQRYTSTFQNVWSLYNTQRAIVGRLSNTSVYGDVGINDGRGVPTDKRYYKFTNTTELTNQAVNSSLYDGTTESSGKPVIEFRENGVSATSGPGGLGNFGVPTSGNNSILYRAINNSQGVDGRMQEFIVYDTYESTHRSDIETNIQTYYGIT